MNLKSLRGSTQQDEDNSEFSVINFAPVPKPKTETAKYLEEKAKLEQLQTQKSESFFYVVVRRDFRKA